MQTLTKIDQKQKRRRWYIACAVYAMTIITLGFTIEDREVASKIVMFFAMLGILTTFVALGAIFGVKFHKD